MYARYNISGELNS